MLFPQIKGIKDVDELEQNFCKRKAIVDSGINPKDLVSILKLKAEGIVPSADSLEKLVNRDKLITKFGIDPTGNDVHLGHAVPLNVARILQSAGHDITLVIGDFTARIGDPTGRTTGRKVLTDEEIKNNYHNYMKQAGKFLNLDRTNVVYNSSMLNDISMLELTKFFQKVSIHSLLERDDFRRRIEGGKGLSLAEVFYPLLMALDSIKMKADLEIGGKDQLLNFLITRDLMEKSSLEPEAFITTPLLPGINGSGEKMSKSLGNYVGLLEGGDTIYGKIMSIPDEILEVYILNFIDMQKEEKRYFQKAIHENPYVFKKALAYFLSSVIVGEKEARMAQEQFDRKFSKRDLNEEDFEPIYSKNGSRLIDILADNDICSKSQARRLIEQGAIKRLNNSREFIKLDDTQFSISNDCYLRIGKKRFIKIIVNNGVDQLSA